MNENKCIICGETFEGKGNNPYPLASFEEGVCCDDCNRDVVIPARLKEIEK